MTAQKKGTIVGTDAFFREIAVGDEIQDLDCRHYTIDQFGRCKPLDGGNAVPLSRINEPALVTKYNGPLEEKPDGKVAPKQEPRVRLSPIAKAYGLDTFHAGALLRSSGLETIDAFGTTWIRASDEPAARIALAKNVRAAQDNEEPAPGPEQPALEGPKGGRNNESGFCQVGNLARRFDLRVSEASAILHSHGIDVFPHGPHSKAHFRLEDLPKCREILAAQTGYDPGNNGNHRPNLSGFVSFANLARSLKAPAWKLREVATAGGFEIIRPGSNAHRNNGISIDDEERFREYAAEQLPTVQSGGRPNASGLVRLESIAKGIGVKGTRGFTSVLREAGIEVVFIDKTNKQAVRVEDRDKAMAILRDFTARRQTPKVDAGKLRDLADTDPVEEIQLPHSAPAEAPLDLARPFCAPPPTLDTISDRALADELRRRGYTVTAFKHIEI